MKREKEEEVEARFTVIQWQELEHQALIFKYLLSGLPVPPPLLSSLLSNLSSSPSSLGYSYCGRESSLYGYGYGYGYAYGYGYGKKVDPEPGRCRRTDGKKWRCSKEAYPDSKYCERHMNRGRNRSRKPVESQSLSSSNSSSSTSSLPYVSASARTLDQTQNLQLSFNALGTASSNDNDDRSEIRLDSIPYAIPTKPYSRHLQGCKPEASEHRTYAQCSDSDRSLLMDSALDNKWPTMLPPLPSFSSSKTMDSSSLHYDYGGQSYVNSEAGPVQPLKQSSQSLQPFFEVWPGTKEAWSGMEDDGANQVTFSTRQLSVSVPIATSDVSPSPQSPKDWQCA